MLPSEPFAFDVSLKTRNEEGVYVGYHLWHNLKHLLIHFDSEDAKDHIAGLSATSVFERVGQSLFRNGHERCGMSIICNTISHFNSHRVANSDFGKTFLFLFRLFVPGAPLGKFEV